ncbi:hypothetical protein HY798_00395 [Candidatus Falkowbacteria bacterium]|nr:hypothetical protein [Candidatus Falkowbacteria bacterium]
MERKGIGIARVVTHPNIHLDEYAAMWLLKKFGGHLFKGVEDAEVVFYNGNGEIPTRDDAIAIGIGGGMFDEHAVGGREGKDGECCATLVAKHLNVKDVAVNRILKYVLRNDTTVGTDSFGLAYMVKLLHRRYPRGVKKVANWVEMALDALYDFFDEKIKAPDFKFFSGATANWLKEKEGGDAVKAISAYLEKHKAGKVTNPFSLAALTDLLFEKHPNGYKKVADWMEMALEAKRDEQAEFFSEAAREFANALMDKIYVGNNEIIVVSGEADSTAFNAYCRHVAFADVVVQRKSTGHTFVFTRQERGRPTVSLREVAAVIRAMEQEKRDALVTTDWRALKSPGHAKGAEMWYYHEAEMLLNGSETAKGLPPTALTLEEVRRAIRIGLDPNFFEATKYRKCRGGHCSSSRRSPCGFHDFGLSRCASLRAKAWQERVACRPK